MQLVLERRAERSTLIAVASPLIAFALTIVTPAEESLLTVDHRPQDSMRLPGAVGIDFRDRRGVRRGASEILTSLMLVYVANLGMDYVVCGPGAIAGPATHRSSSSAMSRTRLERLIEQGDVPFITQPAARASDLGQIAGHAQGI